MPRFELYARREARRGPRPWTPFRALIWLLLFATLGLWLLSLMLR